VDIKEKWWNGRVEQCGVISCGSGYGAVACSCEHGKDTYVTKMMENLTS
jgi:hypothetical protein